MNKKRFIPLSYIFLLILFTNGCAGIRYMTVETQEPARLTLPENIRSLLIVNNVVQQPDEVGHRKNLWEKRIRTGKSKYRQHIYLLYRSFNSIFIGRTLFRYRNSLQ